MLGANQMARSLPTTTIRVTVSLGVPAFEADNAGVPGTNAARFKGTTGS
jgi:hypothetical protein